MNTKVNHSNGLYKPKKGVPLDTLAQLGTKVEITDDFELNAVTTKSDKKALIKRARRKFLSNGLTFQLLNASDNNKRSTLKKAYWNTYHCANILLQSIDDKITGKYCKNRWCMVCNSIRTAQLINRYTPVLDEWNDKYFVTLTIPNCRGIDLKNVIEGMQYTFKKIHARIKKRYQRGKGKRLIGLRKLECTYNSDRNDFHPHFHLIVRGKNIADDIVNYWLSIYTTANIKAQDIRIADDNTVIEMFKYFTKVISKSSNGESKIYADSMDIIFNSIKGKRTFQNFGFKLPKDNVTSERCYTLTEKYFRWCQDNCDWFDIVTGEKLTGYRPNEKFKDLVKNKIIARTGYTFY